jgi:lipopolysaccharide transport system ATP-binding protein
MTDIAIRVENISKQYRIGGRQERYRTLRDTLVKHVSVPFRRFLSVLRGQSTSLSDETIWALKGLSFEVKQGEVMGIIGRNGSGKTTLLKILSRITEPTEGFAEVRGSIGSLLEVGTGFHPELTGRENIYLNGAILGMKKLEIRNKFDDIVAFAEIEKFIDTPVKRYSSGMYVRLAFAVAAYLDPEILIIDEVLAVGDAEFQKKCLDKMDDVSKLGRTVLLVSHNMNTIRKLCSECILINKGALIAKGNPSDVINLYNQSFMTSRTSRSWSLENAYGNKVGRVLSISLKDMNGNQLTEIDRNRAFQIVVDYYSMIVSSRPVLILHFFNTHGIHLFGTHNADSLSNFSINKKFSFIRSKCIVPEKLLNDGWILINVVLATYNPTFVQHAVVWEAISVEITDSSTKNGDLVINSAWPGALRPNLNWISEPINLDLKNPGIEG